MTGKALCRLVQHRQGLETGTRRVSGDSRGDPYRGLAAAIVLRAVEDSLATEKTGHSAGLYSEYNGFQGHSEALEFLHSAGCRELAGLLNLEERLVEWLDNKESPVGPGGRRVLT